MIETSIVGFESCALTDIRRMDGSSHITREQQVLLNFDEVVAIWYFSIALCYGWFRHRKARPATEQRPNRDSTNSIAQYDFSIIHWLILSVAIMGLANFLFSLSLLEVMDHRSSIGSSVLKFSYVSKYPTSNIDSNLTKWNILIIIHGIRSLQKWSGGWEESNCCISSSHNRTSMSNLILIFSFLT